MQKQQEQEERRRRRRRKPSRTQIENADENLQESPSTWEAVSITSVTSVFGFVSAIFEVR